MRRAVLLVAIALTAGCQSQNPFAAIGPPTVPAPGSAQSPPYYPPSTNPASAAKASTPATNTRISVSADQGTGGQSSAPKLATDPADREPIRVVENPQPPTRTASSGARMGPFTAPSTTQPAATQPAPAPPTNALPAAKPKGPNGASIRIDPAIAPASYEQPAAGFVESKPAGGQWRAR